MENANLYAHFQKRFKAHADKVALRTADDRTWTYAQLDAEAARVASFLNTRGLVPGDRVSVQVEKSPQVLFLYLACLRGGFVYHPLNPAYKAAELEFLLADAEPALMICDPASLDLVSEILGGGALCPILTLDASGQGSLMAGVASCSADYPVVVRDSDDMACLLYSSGTTGRPKGIVLTQDNLLSNALALVDLWGFDSRDVLLHVLPVFHVHGLFVALHCVFLSAAELRWLPRFAVSEVVDLLPRCTCMMGVPTYYTRLLAAEDFDAECCRNVRVFISGSAPLLPATFSDFEGRTGQRILERYGMSETGMNSSNPLHGARKAGTVGTAVPGVELRIVGADGETLDKGETGSIRVRGANVFPGYWRLPDKTAADFDDEGFFETGDTGYFDEDGYIVIAGRARDMVISGGLNVYPRELELLLDDIPGIDESAVIGIPHPDLGEAVVAVVVAQHGSDGQLEEKSLLALLKPEISNFKVPKRILIVDALPRNTMGKVQKNLLRERYADLFAHLVSRELG